MESERLLSIQEVAQRLHLQYRTVYRLVISGQIPGAKIGGVYRVRPGDLEKYIEAQKSRTTLEAPVCARCGAPFLTASQVGGKCSATSCDQPLCSVCWTTAEERFCRVHAEEGATLSLGEAEELYARGEIAVFVKGARARLMEIGWIARFDQGVRSREQMPVPGNGRRVQVRTASLIHRTESTLLPRRHVTAPVARQGGRGMSAPQGETSFYYFLPTGQDVQPFAIGVVFLAHTDVYRTRGFDTRPITLAELLNVLGNALETARSRRITMVLGLGSPTGYEAEAEEAIRGTDESKGFFHTNLLVSLVDLLDGRVITNLNDTRTTAYGDMFLGAAEVEKEGMVAQYLRKEVLDGGQMGISLERVARELGVERDMVEKVFLQFVHEGLGRLESGPEGPVFLKEIKTSS